MYGNKLSKIIDFILKSSLLHRERVIIGERGHMEAWQCCGPETQCHGSAID